MIEIVPTPVGDLRADDLNPRRSDPERVAAVGLSLSRFGHVLPLFADEDGRIASGHQRLQGALQVGATVVPVVRLPNGDRMLRASRLMVFNLATNDTPDRQRLTALGADLDVAGLAADLEALDPIRVDDPECWPCMTDLSVMPVTDLLEANPDLALGVEGLEGSRALARAPFRVEMPVVVDRAGRVICGRQRVAAAVTLGKKEWPVVTLRHPRSDVADVALNGLSMRFELGDGFDDVLRAGVWLNHARRRTRLGLGFTHWVRPGASLGFDIDDPADREAWIGVHGTYVADLGAGHLIESGLLNKAGIRAAAFEPFVVDGSSTPDRELSRRMGRVFLDEIRRGRPFDSVFLSAVLNQVPSEEDRLKVLTVAHALAQPPAARPGAKAAPVFIKTLATSHGEWGYFTSGRTNSRFRNYDLRLPGTEEGTVLSSIGLGRVMVTKYYDKAGLRRLLAGLWRSVEISSGSSGSLFARCSEPRAVDPAVTAAAVAFEFDLPWGDGERLGLAGEALSAFSERLGLPLASR